MAQAKEQYRSGIEGTLVTSAYAMASGQSRAALEPNRPRLTNKPPQVQGSHHCKYEFDLSGKGARKPEMPTLEINKQTTVAQNFFQ